MVSSVHIFQIRVPRLERRDFLLQLGDEALGPPLRLPLLLLDDQNQLSLSLLDGAHQLREDLHALLNFSLSADLKVQIKHKQ